MTSSLQCFNYMKQFRCIGAECEDTCCKGWNMQVDAAHYNLYQSQAPQLLEAIVESPVGYVMKRDITTGFCVKYNEGLCKIHSTKGEEFLGDACHFFPRSIRAMGDGLLVSGALSCPESVRQLLATESPFNLLDTTYDRLPEVQKNYLPTDMTADGALDIMHVLRNMVMEDGVSASRSVARLAVIAESLDMFGVDKWSEGVGVMIKTADMRLHTADLNEMDAVNLLHTLSGLIHATGNPARKRLEDLFAKMELLVGIKIDRKTLDIWQTTGREEVFLGAVKCWQKNGTEEQVAPWLQKWLAAQLAIAAFPFSGFGKSIQERIMIIGVRLATLRLALLALMDNNGKIMLEDAILAMQTLARFMDHLAEPELSINLYSQAGWNKGARLRALVGDVQGGWPL